MELNQKTKKKRKFPIKTTIAVIIIIVLIVGYFQITSASSVPAQLHVTSGEVLLNGKQITGNKELKEKDVIETLEGKASVILYESVVVNLDSNTKITIVDLVKEHPRLEQENGKTWNTFTKLAGVEGYSVKEGDNVASVRGSAFELSKNKIIGIEGKVSYDADGKTFAVGALRVIEEVNGEFKERAATPQEIQEIKMQISQTIEELKYLRQKEVEEHPFLTSIVVKTVKIREIQNGEVVSERTLTPEEVPLYLEKADKGEFNVDFLVEQSPISIGYLEKVVDITKAIQKLQQDLDYLG